MPDLAEESKSQSVCYLIVDCRNFHHFIFLIGYRLDSDICSPHNWMLNAAREAGAPMLVSQRSVSHAA